MTNPWMLTANGWRVDLLDPKPETINLPDIIWHLAHINRFTGAASRPLSVLEHSLNVAELVRKMGGGSRAQLGGLFHDAHEAYTGDISSPMKAVLRINGSFIEDRVSIVTRTFDAAIWKALGLPKLTDKDHELIKLADYWALGFERAAVMPPHSTWQFDLKDAPAHILVARRTSISPHQRMAEFEAEYHRLKEVANRRKAA